jgi:hypothetical protein
MLLQAAAALESFSLDTPTSKTTVSSKTFVNDELPVPVLDDRKRSVSPATLSEYSVKTEVPEVKKPNKSLDRSRYVGEVDLPECTCRHTLYVRLFETDLSLS